MGTGAGIATRAGMGIRIHYSDHLVALVGEAAAAVARLRFADPRRLADLAALSRRAAARLSARLDASPLDDATADAIDAGEWTGAAPSPPSTAAVAGWAAALRLDRMDTQDVAAVEYANLLACHDAEAQLAPTFFERPLAAIGTLHGLICQGLVDPAVIGRPRRTAQAVHDGGQGTVVYNAPDPEAVPGLLSDLAAWLAAPAQPDSARLRAGAHPGSAGLPAVVVAAVVHERLLEWQPFEAGNGRVARAAARLVLRARGVDPHGVAVLERPLAENPAAYYGEVAATQRRRGDLGLWVERHTEALVDALEAAADAVAPEPAAAPPATAREAVASLPAGRAVTVTDYAARIGATRETAWAQLRALVAVGALRREPGTRGMRYRRV